MANLKTNPEGTPFGYNPKLDSMVRDNMIEDLEKISKLLYALDDKDDMEYLLSFINWINVSNKLDGIINTLKRGLIVDE